MAVESYFLPQSLPEAAGLLAEHGPTLLVMAGGTIAMPLINEGISFPEKVMGLRRAGLDRVSQANGTVTIGATTTLNQLLRLQAIPMLQAAAHHTAAGSIRNMGTVGGNIFAPPPAGDVAVALLALDARLKLVSARAERVLPLADFYTGFMTNVLLPDELLAEILVPVPAGKTVYLKYGRKQANTPSIVTVAAHLQLAGGRVTTAAVALNGVADSPIRSAEAEAALAGSPLTADTIGAAARAAADAADPPTDAIATGWYRRRMIGVMLTRALTQLMEQEA